MSSNLLNGISPKLRNGATKDGDVYIIPIKKDDSDHIDNIIYDLSIPRLGSNRTFHIGFSKKAVATSTDGVLIIIRYKDDAGNVNYAAKKCDNTKGSWTWFSGSMTIPSGMTLVSFAIATVNGNGGMRITNVTLSYDSPIALAVSEITAADVKDGKGIKSTAITYQASSSQTTVPSGTWATSVPTLSANNPYLWTRTVITYTDNATSTSYSVSSTLKSIKIGGRNLLLNSSGSFTMGFGIPTTTWNKSTGKSEISLPLTPTASEVLPQTASFRKNYQFSVGSTYTQSITVETDANFNGVAPTWTWFEASGRGHIRVDGKIAFADNHVYVFSSTHTIQNGDNGNVRIMDLQNLTSVFDFTTGTYLRFSHPKIERGNIATDWTPAPEDVDAVTVSTLQEQYYSSTSSSSPTDGNWTNQCPAYIDSHWIWTPRSPTLNRS